MTMYASPNFPTKKSLKEAVAAGRRVTVFAPGLGRQPPSVGKAYVSGPHFPKPHKWYAEVSIEHGEVVKVK